MPSAHGAHIKYAWQHQADAILDVAAAQWTWYDIAPFNITQEDVRLLHIFANVTVANEDVVLEITIDGSPIYASTTLTFNTIYEVFHYPSVTANQLVFGAPDTPCLDIRGQAITNMRTRKTTVGGAGHIQYRVVWERLLPT